MIPRWLIWIRKGYSNAPPADPPQQGSIVFAEQFHNVSTVAETRIGNVGEPGKFPLLADPIEHWS